jgi:hypothetical protein
MSRAEKKNAGAELRIHSEVRDQNQVDVRFAYALGGEHPEQRYAVETFLFLPKSIGVNRSNYTRDDFYRDVTALMRLDALPLPLHRLADATCIESPLHVLAELLAELRTVRRPPDARPLVAHVKLYAFLFAAAVRLALRDLSRRIGKRTEVTAASAEDLEAHVAETFDAIRTSLHAYRSMRGSLWPFERLCHESMPEAMRNADEYMSLFLDERLARFSSRLRRVAPDGTGFAARIEIRTALLAREEAAYRRKYGYLLLAGDRPLDGEYFTYRSSLLKKAVQRALYLDPREVKNDPFLRNAVGAVGAALAAIWALAAQIPAALAKSSGNTKLVFFAIPVVAYVMKDRIKALTNEHLVAKLRRFDHTWHLSGATLREVGLGMLEGRIREVMGFLRTDQVPPDVRELRAAQRSLPEAEAAAEEVIHYRKVIDVTPKGTLGPQSDAYSVRDILRLNVKRLLERLDEPVETLEFFDIRGHRFRSTEAPKVYHVNVIVRLSRETRNGDRREVLERLRLVLNKRGIVRIEHVARAAATAVG